MYQRIQSNNMFNRKLYFIIQISLKNFQSVPISTIDIKMNSITFLCYYEEPIYIINLKNIDCKIFNYQTKTVFI
jgi:hypothetical protein